MDEEDYQTLQKRDERLVQNRTITPEEIEGLLRLATKHAALAPYFLKELRGLTDQKFIEILCWFALKNTYPPIRQLVIEEAYAPENLYERILFYYITEQWSKYEENDPSQQLLEAAYKTAVPSLQKLVAAAARKNGRADFLTIALRSDKGLLFDISEQKELVAMLINQQNWVELWIQLDSFSPSIVLSVIKELASAGWQPSEAAQKSRFERLHNLIYLDMAAVISDVQFTRFVSKLLIEFEKTPFANSLISWVRFSPDNRLVGYIEENKLKIYNLTDFQNPVCIYELKITGTVGHLFGHYFFSPNGKYLAYWTQIETYQLGIVNRVNLHVIEIASGKEILTIPTPYRDGPTAVFTHDGHLLTFALKRNFLDTFLGMYALPSGKIVSESEEITYNSSLFYALRITADNKLLILAAANRKLCLWHPQKKEFSYIHFSLGDGQKLETTVALSPGGNLLACLNYDYTIELLDTRNGAAYFQINTIWGVRQLKFSPDGRFLAIVANSGQIFLWDVLTCSMVLTIQAGRGKLRSHNSQLTNMPYDEVAAIMFATDISFLMSFSETGLLQKWSLHAYSTYLKPVKATSPQDWLWLNHLNLDSFDKAEKNWLAFLRELLAEKWGREIELEATPNIKAENFDIELEG